MLKDAQAELAKHLDEACAHDDVEDVSTAQLMRLEESLTEAAAAAKQAVSIRRRLGTRHGPSDPSKTSTEKETGDTPVNQRPAVERRGDDASTDQTSAVREFRDARGVLWRVWAVTPSLTQSDRPQSYRLGEYSDGWLAFESDDGSQRCRLPHYPRDWSRKSNQALEELLERAEPVRARRKNRGDDADTSPR